MTFLESVMNASAIRETKADIVDYYREVHPRNWQAKLVHDLHPFTSGVKTEHNLARRFNSGAKGGENRLDRPGSKREQAEYKAFGATLPRKVPKSGFHVTGTIYVQYSQDCVKRKVDIILNRNAASRLIGMAKAEAIQAVANGYQSDLPEADIDFQGPAWCAEPDLHATAA